MGVEKLALIPDGVSMGGEGIGPEKLPAGPIGVMFPPPWDCAAKIARWKAPPDLLDRKNDADNSWVQAEFACVMEGFRLYNEANAWKMPHCIQKCELISLKPETMKKKSVAPRWRGCWHICTIHLLRSRRLQQMQMLPNVGSRDKGRRKKKKEPCLWPLRKFRGQFFFRFGETQKFETKLRSSVSQFFFATSVCKTSHLIHLPSLITIESKCQRIRRKPTRRSCELTSTSSRCILTCIKAYAYINGAALPHTKRAECFFLSTRVLIVI